MLLIQVILILDIGYFAIYLMMTLGVIVVVISQRLSQRREEMTRQQRRAKERDQLLKFKRDFSSEYR